MGRAPCCEKMGLKKGPWTREEDEILINYITHNGHDNWRALPKLAGLLRCGKSCRLRWMNYLRPDIKRGNFTREEEDTIIRLYQELGNRWSVIAARLPGRTDNEIKNVWHTHLKKRLNKNCQSSFAKSQMHSSDDSSFDQEKKLSQMRSPDDSSFDQEKKPQPNSPVHSSSTEISSSFSSTATAAKVVANAGSDADYELPEMDESFWTEVFSSGDDSSVTRGSLIQIPLDVMETSYSFDSIMENGVEASYVFDSNKDDGSMDFWFDVFTKAGELGELPEL